MSYFELKPIGFRGNIAIVAPSSGFDRQHFNAGITFLKLSKFKPVIDKAIFDKYFYSIGKQGNGNSFSKRVVFDKRFFLAGTPQTRAEVLINAFLDDNIEAIWVARGGFGALQLLPFLDKHIEKIKQHPKLLIGFSDITILHSYFIEKCGFVGVHGPNITTLERCSADSKKQVVDLLFGEDRAFDISEKHISVVQNGKAKGIVKGGNLSSIISLLGTPYEPDFSDSILFLEDVNEVPYKIDRMITQLKYAGKFDKIRGLILGDFSYREYNPPRTKHFSPELITKLAEISENVPVLGNFPSGHGTNNLAFLLGAIGEIDTEKRMLSYFTE
jgi:muramoyltetrapeptide carboxypeptidase